MNDRIAKMHPHNDQTLHKYVVRIQHDRPEPVNSLQRLTVAMLRKKSPIPFDLLVQLLADELYQQELNDGAWVLDLGLFGRTLFIADVAGAIRAGNGTYWQIEKQS
jgi:hypothetical protein